MEPSQEDIIITIHHNGYETAVHTHDREYRNLMQLISDRIYVENFGDCKGMGRCGTCQVLALNHTYDPGDYERNELNTLSKPGAMPPGLRLSCQLMIDKNISGLHFEIVETN
jgi:2Fe-2S ferredoxin